MKRNDLIQVFTTSQDDRSNVRANAEKVYNQVICRTVDGDLLLDVFTWDGGIKSNSGWYALNDDDSVIYNIGYSKRHLINLRDSSSICYTCINMCYMDNKKECGLFE